MEVKKEPEAPTEVVKQEEREPGTKSAAPAAPSKQPPEKRARLQWHLSSSLGRVLSFFSISAYMFTLVVAENKLALEGWGSWWSQWHNYLNHPLLIRQPWACGSYMMQAFYSHCWFWILILADVSISTFNISNKWHPSCRPHLGLLNAAPPINIKCFHLFISPTLCFVWKYIKILLWLSVIHIFSFVSLVWKHDRIMEPNYLKGVITIIWGCLCITLKRMYLSTSFFILLQFFKPSTRRLLRINAFLKLLRFKKKKKKIKTYIAMLRR